MLLRIRYAFIAILLTCSNNLFSQDITGTWEGDLANSEFLQINIVQVGDIACGYTWDYLYGNRRDYCMANFTAVYDKKEKQWVLTGTSFIENSGDHVLMNMRLQFDFFNGKTTLAGWENPLFKNKSLLRYSRLFQPNVFLKKVSASPSQVLDNMKDCSKAKQQQEKDDTITVLRPNGATVQKIPLPQNWIGEVEKPVIPGIAKDSIALLKQMADRTNKETSHLVVSEKNITLDVYDNGIVDGDTVSIFYNGKLILSHQPLTVNAIVIPLTLDEKTTRQEITLFAENLGSIPPNTALVVVHAGKKRYELYASASLTENAVIVFDYKPK